MAYFPCAVSNADAHVVFKVHGKQGRFLSAVHKGRCFVLCEGQTTIEQPPCQRLLYQMPLFQLKLFKDREHELDLKFVIQILVVAGVCRPAGVIQFKFA